MKYPDDWQLVRLDDCAEILMGQSPKGDTYNTNEEGIPLLNGPVEFGRRFPTAVQWTTSPTRIANSGDILFCVRGNTTGRMNVADQPYCIGRGLAAIRGKPAKAETAFVSCLLEFIKPRIYNIAVGGGSTFPNISRGSLLEFDVPKPPLAEQRRIAGVLSLVQRAIEEQERLIALTTELKTSLLHRLFTKGLRGEPQKQTEIGPLPQSWEVVTLEDAAVTFDYGTSVKCEHGKAGVPVLRIPNVVAGSIDLSDLKHGQPKRSELDQLLLQDGDLLFVRTNGVLENAGRCALYRGELENCYFASYLIRVRVDCSKVLPGFVNEYARAERGRGFLSGRAIRTADGKFNINSGTLKRVMLPLPNLAEQTEIVDNLTLAERKLSLHDRKHAALTALFRTLLHQLMTAQLRVYDLDLSEFGLT